MTWSPVGGLWRRGLVHEGMDGWMDEGEKGIVGREVAGNEGCNGCME